MLCKKVFLSSFAVFSTLRTGQSFAPIGPSGSLGGGIRHGGVVPTATMPLSSTLMIPTTRNQSVAIVRAPSSQHLTTTHAFVFGDQAYFDEKFAGMMSDIDVKVSEIKSDIDEKYSEIKSDISDLKKQGSNRKKQGFAIASVLSLLVALPYINEMKPSDFSTAYVGFASGAFLSFFGLFLKCFGDDDDDDDSGKKA